MSNDKYYEMCKRIWWRLNCIPHNHPETQHVHGFVEYNNYGHHIIVLRINEGKPL
jgi:hypothetical protein